jgi:hypothetical protein
LHRQKGDLTCHSQNTNPALLPGRRYTSIHPDLTCDNHRIEPEKTPEEGYHLTEDLVDKAIGFIADSKQVAPNKLFFIVESCNLVPLHFNKVS